MSLCTEHLIALSAAISQHEGVTHWAVSSRLTGKGDFIERLLKGGDVRTATYEDAMRRFATSWPADLEWPRDIPRPKLTGREAA